MNVPKDYEEFFALLNEQKVKYLIIGAYVLAYHGCPRYTGDIDIFCFYEPKQCNKNFYSPFDI